MKVLLKFYLSLFSYLIHTLKSSKNYNRNFRNSNHDLLLTPPKINIRKKRDNRAENLFEPELSESNTKPSPELEKLLFDQRLPQDPYFNDQWYLYRPTYKSGYYHLNVTAAWAMGYTGRGSTVTILDDGLEHTHEDLNVNFAPAASWDFNDDDPDPMPRKTASEKLHFRDGTLTSNYYSDDSSESSSLLNRHGTRCAGEIAAVKDNNKCVTGIAYNSNIGGLKILDGDISDIIEMKALRYNSEKVIDIYSSSWGPDDDGKTVDGPGKLTAKAMEDGIKNGRHGYGSIYVWASGNGGKFKDSCSADGYCNSIFTITVASTTEREKVPWYSEKCSSILTTTYSSGIPPESAIVTTDIHNGCTHKHTGTSASAPIAASILALVLEANPKLNWREIQHLIVETSNPFLVRKSGNFQKNGAGFYYSHSYGFGVMDAGRMCEVAANWDFSRVLALEIVSKVIFLGERKFLLDRQADNASENQTYIEHFQVDRKKYGFDPTKTFKIETVSLIITVQFPYRGLLTIYLTSPSGTRSQLLFPRPNDRSKNGFNRWSLMSVACWGESPIGEWTLEFKSVLSGVKFSGVLNYMKLEFTGMYGELEAENIVDQQFVDQNKCPKFYYYLQTNQSCPATCPDKFMRVNLPYRHCKDFSDLPFYKMDHSASNLTQNKRQDWFLLFFQRYLIFLAIAITFIVTFVMLELLKGRRAFYIKIIP